MSFHFDLPPDICIYIVPEKYDLLFFSLEDCALKADCTKFLFLCLLFLFASYLSLVGRFCLPHQRLCYRSITPLSSPHTLPAKYARQRSCLPAHTEIKEVRVGVTETDNVPIYKTINRYTSVKIYLAEYKCFGWSGVLFAENFYKV